MDKKYEEYKKRIVYWLLSDMKRYIDEYANVKLNSIERYFFNKHYKQAQQYILTKLQQDGYEIDENLFR